MSQYTASFVIPVRVRVRNLDARSAKEAVNIASRSVIFSSLVDKRQNVPTGMMGVDRVYIDNGPLTVDVSEDNGFDSEQHFDLDDNFDVIDADKPKPVDQVMVSIRKGMIYQIFSNNPAIKTARILNDDLVSAFARDVADGSSQFTEKGINNQMPVVLDQQLSCWSGYKAKIEAELKKMGVSVCPETGPIEILGNTEWWDDMRGVLPRGPKQPTEAEIAKAASKQSEDWKIQFSESMKKLRREESLKSLQPYADREAASNLASAITSVTGRASSSGR